MNTPMILPWLAVKWGVKQERAVILWRKACDSAQAEVGNSQSSEYWECANRHLIDLLDNEIIARYPVTETPWIMMHLNILRLLALARLWVTRGEERLSAAILA